ncbi:MULTISPECIES: adenosylcobinamide-GDP ribazoletransferase [Methanobrevibacter]|jgi:adenosylcobinamide-GDP ribazoletransferase|uniref:Adenosylcobinamide-GDP ribazoletransferase n=1 Tax=Methanobrevibacter thaueri TaxID=190975 RepID=A0A315XMI4_9EURY|nr:MULTISPECIES: adenosylcobinamide-GDP ribazoletransferase [Methanobrevibacter]MBR2665697.1 adenosylcobinamide-GDP ribazoletransferase [Methanobrevibacter sp.]MBR3197595.1 adenosylcobinamide-GDP ribazoletransferase [Methanobrevibacter sp.]MBR6928205.1 adenosylcobinamide-GDP ribazoletransferase [Methanobrevibacter sp.]PWB86946.1 cobalamin synthase [Methanobrevibacter thaueri]
MEDDSYFEDEEFSPIRSLLGLLTFSTILPINVFTSIEYMTKLTWAWPFIHIFIGILAAICGYISLEILHLNSFFAAVIVYAFLMIITGYNHLDGVMDMADGVMVHGEPERKIRVMKDSSVGSGGVATLFLVASLTIAGIYNILDYNFIIGIIICEMLAKTSLLTTALLSKPLTPGIGSYFINETTPSKYFISTAIITTFAFLLGGLVGIFGALGAIISGTIIAVIAKRNFVLANGDVLGMSNEVGRLFSLLFMAVALYFL